MNSLVKKCITTLLIVVSMAVNIDAQTRSDKKRVQTHKKETTNKLAKNKQELEKNKKETSRLLRELSVLDDEISVMESLISRQQTTIDSLNQRIAEADDSILMYEVRIADLSAKYAKALRTRQRRNINTSSVNYLFASKNFSEAYRKYRALKQFSTWRKKKSEEILNLKAIVEQRKNEVEALKEKQESMLSELNDSKTKLDQSKTENQNVVASLQNRSKELQDIIAQQQRELKRLDDELNRIIAEEIRIAEEKRKEEERLRKQAEAEAKKRQAQAQAAQNANSSASVNNSSASTERASNTTTVTEKNPTGASTAKLSEGFQASKGKLPFPVAGKHIIVRGFGRQKHPSLPMIETDNPGIDILVDNQAKAFSVYEGEVSAIFKQPGYNNVVMIRHGNYLTIYANLEDVSVKKGERVGEGKEIGTIAIDEDDKDLRSILHFEIRHEKNKEDPSKWLR